MAAAPDGAAPSGDREIVVERTFEAPVEVVWRAWTDPALVAGWWGPKGFDTRVIELDLRPGGRSRYVMVGPDGTEYPVTGVFREVVPHERIVTTDEFDEAYEAPEGVTLPTGIVLTCLFEAEGDRTKLTMRIAHRTREDRRTHEDMGVVAGWNSSFDCLDELLGELKPARP